VRARTPTREMVTALYEVVTHGLRAHSEAHRDEAGRWTHDSHRATAEDAEEMLRFVLETHGSQRRTGASRVTGN
jgi:hypothetical protein